MVSFSKLFLFAALPYSSLGNTCPPPVTSEYDVYIKEFTDDPVYDVLKAIPANKPYDKCGFLLIQLQRERRERSREKHELIKQIGKENSEKKAAVHKALRAFIIPYLCARIELYLDTWDPSITASGLKATTSTTESPGEKKEIFDPGDIQGTEVVRHDLDSQTKSNYKNNARKLFRIFTESDHPSVHIFKQKVLAKYPNISLDTIAKNFGLAIALLHNHKHGVLANDPDLVLLVNPDNVVDTLRRWKALTEPVLLDIIRVFEEVTESEK